MSWANLDEFIYPVLNQQGESVAIFKSQRKAAQFCNLYNSKVSEDMKLEVGTYVDAHTEIQIRCE